MLEWLSQADFEARFARRHKEQGLFLEDRLAIAGDLESAIRILGTVPHHDPPGMGSPPGPIAVWFGAIGASPITITWNHKYTPQFGVIALRNYAAGSDSYLWSMLTDLECLPKELFSSITGVLWDGQSKDDAFVIGSYLSEPPSFVPIYCAATRDEAEALVSTLSNLGSRTTFEICSVDCFTPQEMRRISYLKPVSRRNFTSNR